MEDWHGKPRGINGQRKDLVSLGDNSIYKSAFEANVARIFQFLKYSYKYEPKKFFLKHRKVFDYYYPGVGEVMYIPDFELGDGHLVEVKGSWSKGKKDPSAFKIVFFLEDYLNEKLLIIYGKPFPFPHNSLHNPQRVETWYYYGLRQSYENDFNKKDSPFAGWETKDFNLLTHPEIFKP